MPHRLETHLPRLIDAVINGKLLVVTDLDGALVNRKPAIHDPVEPDFELDAIFTQIQSAGNPVSINTGRPDIFVRNLFPSSSPNMWVATETGAHIAEPVSLKAAFKKAVEGHGQLVKLFHTLVPDYPGVIVEDHKSCAITLSLKNVDPANIIRAYNHFQHIARQEAGDVANIIAVHKPGIDTYIEIVPHGIDKGSATDFIFQKLLKSGSVPICFGDTVADQPMMAVVNDMNGVSFGVGDKAPDNAVVRLDSVEQSRAVMKLLAGQANVSAPRP